MAVTYTNSTLTVRDCVVRRADIPSVWRVLYSDCVFNSPILQGSEVAAPVCSAASGNNYTTINGGRLDGAFDVSNVFGISGLASTAPQSANAVLPSGVTRAQLFTGWMAS